MISLDYSPPLKQSYLLRHITEDAVRLVGLALATVHRSAPTGETGLDLAVRLSVSVMEAVEGNTDLFGCVLTDLVCGGGVTHDGASNMRKDVGQS